MAGSEQQVPCIICAEPFQPGQRSALQACSGCKAFFRRSIRLGLRYSCSNPRGCNVVGPDRVSCRFCRFQKCLDVGMRKRPVCTKGHAEPGKVMFDTWSLIQAFRNDPVVEQMGKPDSPSEFGYEGCLKTISPNPQHVAAPVGISNERDQKPDSFTVVLSYARQHQERVNTAVAAMTSLGTKPPDNSRKERFGRGNEKLFDVQTSSYLVALKNALGPCVWLSSLSKDAQEILIENYEPQALLLCLIIDTMSAMGEFILLVDGAHSIDRIFAEDARLTLRFRHREGQRKFFRNVIRNLQEELLPRFRSLNVDENEIAILRQLTLWNSGLPCLDYIARQTVTNIQQLLHDCLWKYTGTRAAGKSECSSTFVDSNDRYADLLDLHGLLQASAPMMKAYLRYLKSADYQVHDDIEFRMISTVLQTDEAIAGIL